MNKVSIDYDTFDKLREIARDALDNSLKELFTVNDKTGKEVKINTCKYVENSQAFINAFNTDLKGYRYKYGTGTFNIDTDFNYPIIIHYNPEVKTWWVDAHNLSTFHSSFKTMVKDKYGDSTLLLGSSE